MPNYIFNNNITFRKEYVIRFVSEFFSKSFNFLIIPLITYSLSVIDYGFYVQIICIVSGLIPIVTMGLNFTIIKNLAGNSSIKNNSQKFFTTIFFICSSCIILLFISYIIMYFINNRNFEVIYFIILLILASSLEIITLEMLRAKTQSNLFCFLQVFSPLMILFLLFIISNFNFLSISIILISFSSIKILTVIIGIFLLVKKKFIVFNFFKTPKNFFKIYLYPGITFMLIGISEWIINYSDKLILGYFMNNKIVSIYYTIGLLSSGILSIGSIFWWRLYPNISKLKLKNKKKEIFELIYDLNNIFIELVIPTILILVLSGPFLINILLNINDFSSNLLIFYFSIAILIHQISTGWEFYCYVEEKGKFILKNTIFWGIISLILNFILIPKFSIYAAISVLFVSKFGFSISLFLYVKNNGYSYKILNHLNAFKLIISFLVAIFVFIILRNINFFPENQLLQISILSLSALSIYYTFRYLIFFYLKNKNR
ncbi:lipopolysaccharide biosynthesis protein [Rickettsiales bacterium]|nr:lipopolysaccharide biosynthesis protein [Rickettsiales bacterium]